MVCRRGKGNRQHLELAEEQIYHKHVSGHSPVIKSMKMAGSKAVLTFLYASGGLRV
jgi:hypothetical protein